MDTVASSEMLTTVVSGTAGSVTGTAPHPRHQCVWHHFIGHDAVMLTFCSFVWLRQSLCALCTELQPSCRKWRAVQSRQNGPNSHRIQWFWPCLCFFTHFPYV